MLWKIFQVKGVIDMSDEFEKLAGTAPTLTLTPFPEKKEELPQQRKRSQILLIAKTPPALKAGHIHFSFFK